ncbi:HDIG domain-containing protein, partial [Myxococcota bacterium]|nr:HDIG domain-containing protein [Myxococcota bacterium]
MDRNELKLVGREREPSLETQVLEISSGQGNTHWLFFLSFFFFIIAVTFFVAGTGGLFPDILTKNDIGKRPKKAILATRSFTFLPDEELLRKKSEEAALNVRAVYSSRNNGWLDIWHRQISFGFRAIKDPIFREKEDLARLRFNELAGISLDKVTFWSLSNSVGYDRLKSILQTLFTNVLKDQLLVRDIEALRAKHPGGIEVLVYNREGTAVGEKPTRRIIPSTFKELLDLNQLSAKFLSEIETRYSLGDKDNLDRDARKAIHTVSMALIAAHLAGGKGGQYGLGIVYRPELTEKRRIDVKKQVTAQPRVFNKGDVIVRVAEPISLETVKIFRTMVPTISIRIFSFLGDFFFIASFFLIIGWFATLKFGGRRGVIKDFYAAGLLFLLFLGMVKGSWYLVNGMVSDPDPMLYPAVFPAAGGAFLIKVLMGNRFAVFFSIAIGFLATWAIGAPVPVALFYFLTGLAAAGASDRVEHRYVIWKSGFMIIGINLFLILVLRMVNGDLTKTSTLWYLLCGVGGGVLLGVLMSALLPIVEYLGDYITDIKLLELTNTDHPLLQELNEKATGTYMHSQTVAQLAFSAAKKVGANALLVKVAAFYHDVGKTRQPRFFIENQAGENPHDKLKPSMSALVIRNHIKDTREILEKAGIPKLVIDIASS